MSIVLAGDIGGTNTRLRLWKKEDGRVVQEKEFTNSGKDLSSIVKDFLQEAGVFPLIACFAVAGPVDKKNNICHLTNLAWNLNGNDLAQELGIERVILINDFEAVGYGVLEFRELEETEAFQEFQPGEEKNRILEDAPLGIIGAGTGLGEAFMLKSQPDDKWKVFSTEGGHVDFAARSLEEFELQEYIKKQYGLNRVSVERVVSGPGIVTIYQFLRDLKEYSESKDIASIVKDWEESGRDFSKAPSEKISEGASNGDQICNKVLRIFTEAYGSEVGNFILKLLPYEGLYIAGGIAPKILTNKNLQKLFMKELKNKGRMAELIEKIPIRLVKNEQIGLFGAAYYAKQYLV
jgi:glucokinase